MTVESHEQQALDYLKAELGSAAPGRIEPAFRADGEPLEGEGPTTLYGFDAAPGGGPTQRFWVAAGQTQPNYYPDWGLSADEMYSVHLGTRFMLVMEAAQVPLDRVPRQAWEWFPPFLAGVAPGTPIVAIRPRAAFDVHGEIYALAEAELSQERVAVIGYQAPPGIYREVHLLPQVLLRRHLGALIRREAEAAERESRLAQVRSGRRGCAPPRPAP